MKTLTIGTSYFPSVEAAREYYRPYAYTTLNKAVQQKLDAGEIHIGKPPLKDGQLLITLDNGLRYGIVEQEADTRNIHGHEFVNSDPTKFDSNCAVCDGKQRDAIHNVEVK